MEKEKVVSVKYPDGSEHTITVGAITRKQRKDLNLLVLPPKFNQKDADNGTLMVDATNLEEFKDRLVTYATKAKVGVELGSLDESEFDKLFDAAQELNPGANIKQRESTEKKSESPSSAG